MAAARSNLYGTLEGLKYNVVSRGHGMSASCTAGQFDHWQRMAT